MSVDMMSERIRCSHILVKNEQQARDILARLSKGEKFSALAAECSIDGSRKRGGDLGLFSHGSMVREFENAAFALKKGETSGIVKSQFGYHIIKRTL